MRTDPWRGGAARRRVTVAAGRRRTGAATLAIALVAALVGGCSAAGSSADTTASTGAERAPAQSGEGTQPPAPTDAAAPQAEVHVEVDREELEEWLDGWRADRDLAGAVTGVQVGDGPPVVVASGHEGPGSDDPLDPSAPFFIASVTKTFVAALVLQLAEEGAVDLDAPVTSYIELWPAASEVTLRHLLSHTSGLPSLANLDSRHQWDDRLLGDLDRVWTAEEALEVIDHDALFFPPGTDYHYSNANFVVAGLVIEAVTGNELADEIRTRLTGPLGLDDTYLHPGTTPIDPAIPRGVHAEPDEDLVFDTEQVPLTAILTVSGAAGAMVSTPADLLRWMRALHGGTAVLEADTVAAMYDPATDRGLGTKGFCPCADDGEPYGRGHDGVFPGFYNVTAYYRLGDTSIVLYVNDTPVSDLDDALVEIAALITEPIADD